MGFPCETSQVALSRMCIMVFFGIIERVFILLLARSGYNYFRKCNLLGNQPFTATKIYLETDFITTANWLAYEFVWFLLMFSQTGSLALNGLGEMKEQYREVHSDL